MLKTIRSPDKPAPNRNNGSRLASNRNNNNKPASGRNNGNGKVDEFVGDGVEHTKKSEKLKSQKLAKFWKLSNSRKSKGEKSKKPSKNRNLLNFNATKAEPNFLIPSARAAFNRLWLAFIKAPILWHFDPEYYIWIEIDASDYVISGVQSQLTSGTNLNGIVTKTNLGKWHLIAFFFRKMFLQKLGTKSTTVSF